MKSTFDSKPFVAKPTSYGQVNEKTAKAMYIKKTGNHCHDVGLVVNPMFPFLGASPDAIVCADGVSGLVEIKCPYAARDYTIIEATEKVKDFFLENNGGNIKLKQSHKHYFQVQGQLLSTGLPFCDFVVFTRQDLFIQRIKPNKEVIEWMLTKLTDFYINFFKPYRQAGHFVQSKK